MQRRTTRVGSRQTVAENANSTKPGLSRVPAPKTRTASAGLSLAKGQDPNTANTNNGAGASKGGSKPAISKDTIASSTTAPIKRKREALPENANAGGRPLRAKAPDKENQQVKKSSSTAYVEIPHANIAVAAAASRTRTTATSRGTTAVAGTTRSRIVVKRDDDVGTRKPAVKREPTTSVEPSPPPAPSQDDAMLIDNHPAATSRHAAAPRHPSTRSSHVASSQSQSTTTRRTTSSSIKRTASTSSRSARRVKEETPVEPEVVHVAKKRRTSSVGPEEREVVAPLHEHAQPTILEEHVEEAQEAALVDEAKWDDLDKEDEADPLMVSEYVADIFQYLRKLEIDTMPNPHYIDMQKDLAWKMRGILMDWLIQVHGRFRLLPETLYLAVNIIDRFLSTRVVSLVRLQLVGITAMFIASKYEEVLSPSLAHFMSCSDSTYTERDILDAEKYILRSLDYNLSYPNPINFLRRASKADNYDLQVRTVAKYLIEIGCVDWRLLGYPPSHIAAAGIWFARLILEKEPWGPTLVHYSGWTEKEILPVAQLMLTYLLRQVKHESFYKKYAAKKYMRVSAYVREWLWAKFGQGAVNDYDVDGEPTTGVDPMLHIHPSPGSVVLEEELPRLREEIRITHEGEEGLDGGGGVYEDGTEGVEYAE